VPSRVFYPKRDSKVPGVPIGTLLRRKMTKGEIGIEIEVEGNQFPKHAYNGRSAVSPELIPSIWNYHHDGSLRGDDNAEYVLKQPIKFTEVKEAINSLWDMFNKFGSVLAESNRTSVHIHLNVQNFHLNRLCSFMAMYLSVEEILTAWCGEHRIGNLFCLRAKDAPAIVTHLKKFFQTDGGHEIRDGMHYAGMNAQALFKFGSLEIRSLRGVSDPQVILDWVAVLERMYNLSKDFTDPRAIMDNFSGGGAMGYLEMILGDKLSVVRNNIDFDNQRIMESLYEGIRLAQDLCYCRDWSEYEPVDVKDDPFGRNTKKAVPADYPTNDSAFMSLNQAIGQAAQPYFAPESFQTWTSTFSVSDTGSIDWGTPHASDEIITFGTEEESDDEDEDADDYDGPDFWNEDEEYMP